MKIINNKRGGFKMAWYVWVILGLLIFSYYQYTNAEKANKLAEPVWGKVHSFLVQSNPFKGGGSVTISTVKCPDVEEPVCANGIDYKNSCEAAKAGISEVTPGVCA